MPRDCHRTYTEGRLIMLKFLRSGNGYCHQTYIGILRLREDESRLSTLDFRHSALHSRLPTPGP